jgi:hypothetical protein
MITKITVSYYGHKGAKCEFIICIRDDVEYAHYKAVLDVLIGNRCDFKMESEKEEDDID